MITRQLSKFAIPLFLLNLTSSPAYSNSPRCAHLFQDANYKWLEDVFSEVSNNWVEYRSRKAKRFLKDLPQRAGIRQRLIEIYSQESINAISYRGGYYYYNKRGPGQNQPNLYRSKTWKRTREELVLDIDSMSKHGNVALKSWSLSPDQNLISYGLLVSGSDRVTWYVKDLKTGATTSDKVRFSKGQHVVWAPDSSGFYYTRMEAPKDRKDLIAPNSSFDVYFHRVGTDQKQDTLISPSKERGRRYLNPMIIGDNLFIQGSIGEKSILSYRPWNKNSAWKSIHPSAGKYAGSQGSSLFFISGENAPFSKLIAIDLNNPQKSNWRTIIPDQGKKLEDVMIIGDQILTSYLDHVDAYVAVFDMNGRELYKVPMPEMGSVDYFSWDSKQEKPVIVFSNFTRPQTFYTLDMNSRKLQTFYDPPKAFDASQFQTRRIFYESKDGTSIPMFLVYKKGTKLDGTNPTLLYGYGGFNSVMNPFFNPTYLAFVEMGGVFAVANIRGGGEYGRDWYEAGVQKNKQNVFDDFIAAAETLIENGITSKPHLAATGASNGGLLAAAMVTQRPDLFAAVVPKVGVLDMTNFHKYTAGIYWTYDYGNPENSADLTNVLKYSPFHRVKKGEKYPATLIMTADYDDRVVPFHSYKFAAALQAAQGGDKPILLRVDHYAGHGSWKPVEKSIEEAADELTFLSEFLKSEK